MMYYVQAVNLQVRYLSVAPEFFGEKVKRHELVLDLRHVGRRLVHLTREREGPEHVLIVVVYSKHAQ